MRSRERKLVNLSMPVKEPVADYRKRSIWKSGKSFGKKPFGVRVSALLTAGGALVEVIHQDIETQGGKKY